MAVFKGKLPTKTLAQINVPEIKTENTVKAQNVASEVKVEQPKPSFKVPEAASEDFKLKAKIRELELKIEILEHTKERFSNNDREYIVKLENIVKQEKAVARAMMLQNVELRMLCGKYADHLPKIDLTEDDWEVKLKALNSSNNK